jgi:putative transposase
LVELSEEYAFTGCLVPGYPELDVKSEDFWMRYWRVFEYLRGGDVAGE